MLWGVIGVWLAALWAVTMRVLCRPRAQARVPPTAPYTLVRICGGPEPHLHENLVSILQASGERPTGVLLVVPHDDPQRAVVQAACDVLAASDLPTTLLPTDVGGPNHKVAQLDASWACWPAHHDIVCADGDVDLSGYPMDDLRAPLAERNVAAVWAPCAEANDGPSAAVLHSSLHCFALLGRLDPGGMVGKLWAVRCHAMLRVGGWRSLVNILGEDMELARRMRRLGLRVVMCDAAGRSRPAPRSLSATIARYARWFWVIRAQRPHLLASYPLLFFGTTCLLVLCGLQAGRAPGVAAAVAAAALGLRLLLTLAARRATGAPRRRLVRDSAVAEFIVLAAFACMLCQSTVHWRHQRLRVSRGGRIVAMGEAL